MPTFTPSQQTVLDILSDGNRHSMAEILKHFDEQTEMLTIQVHISNIRKFLRLKGEDILCETDGRRSYYRHVRLLASPSRE